MVSPYDQVGQTVAVHVARGAHAGAAVFGRRAVAVDHKAACAARHRRQVDGRASGRAKHHIAAASIAVRGPSTHDQVGQAIAVHIARGAHALAAEFRRAGVAVDHEAAYACCDGRQRNRATTGGSYGEGQVGLLTVARRVFVQNLQGVSAWARGWGVGAGPGGPIVQTVGERAARFFVGGRHDGTAVARVGRQGDVGGRWVFPVQGKAVLGLGRVTCQVSGFDHQVLCGIRSCSAEIWNGDRATYKRQTPWGPAQACVGAVFPGVARGQT